MLKIPKYALKKNLLLSYKTHFTVKGLASQNSVAISINQLDFTPWNQNLLGLQLVHHVNLRKISEAIL